jgi:hypothetical protein
MKFKLNEKKKKKSTYKNVLPRTVSLSSSLLIYFLCDNYCNIYSKNRKAEKN